MAARRGVACRGRDPPLWAIPAGTRSPQGAAQTRRLPCGSWQLGDPVRKMSYLLALALSVAFVGVLAPAAQAAATVRWVGTGAAPVAPGTGCGAPGYATITAAVTAAVAG